MHLQYSSLREAALMAEVSKSALHKRAKKKGGGSSYRTQYAIEYK